MTNSAGGDETTPDGIPQPYDDDNGTSVTKGSRQRPVEQIKRPTPLTLANALRSLRKSKRDLHRSLQRSGSLLSWRFIGLLVAATVVFAVLPFAWTTDPQLTMPEPDTEAEQVAVDFFAALSDTDSAAALSLTRTAESIDPPPLPQHPWQVSSVNELYTNKSFTEVRMSVYALVGSEIVTAKLGLRVTPDSSDPQEPLRVLDPFVDLNATGSHPWELRINAQEPIVAEPDTTAARLFPGVYQLSYDWANSYGAPSSIVYATDSDSSIEFGMAELPPEIHRSAEAEIEEYLRGCLSANSWNDLECPYSDVPFDRKQVESVSYLYLDVAPIVAIEPDGAPTIESGIHDLSAGVVIDGKAEYHDLLVADFTAEFSVDETGDVTVSAVDLD